MGSKEYLGEVEYLIVSDYNEAPTGSRIRFEGVIDSKPVITHTPSIKPFEIQVLRYYVNTRFSVDGIKVLYEGPAFLKKDQKITLWGKKKYDHFLAVRIESDDFIIKLD